MGPEQVEAKGLLRELRSIARCGRQVWVMVPGARKLALLSALVVIAVFALGPIVREAFSDTCEAIRDGGAPNVSATCDS